VYKLRWARRNLNYKIAPVDDFPPLEVDHPILIYAFCLPLIQIEMVPDVLLD
jgi:hypothetical protein